MKKKVIIFRFGSATPTQKEYAIIGIITGGSGEATGCSTPFGIISIANTDLEPAEITKLFNTCAQETGDSLPTIVFDAAGEVGFNFDQEFFTHFNKCNTDFDEMFGTSKTDCILSLDELLDLVNSKGLDHFTSEELTRLKELSSKF
jgi:hypothetical protein